MSGLLVIAQSEAAVPAGDAWLAPAERRRAEGLAFAARRRDYRLGRWTAKRALAHFLGAAQLSEIEVRGAAKTPPTAYLRGASAPCAISLSHRDGSALAAVAPAGTRLGCDLERDEPRSDEFVSHYFAPRERAWLESLAEPLRSRAAALAWSAKESAVKALGTGLDRDPRDLEVEFVASVAPASRWRRLSVAFAEEARLGGFWCQRGAWLLTVVADPSLAAPRWISR